MSHGADWLSVFLWDGLDNQRSTRKWTVEEFRKLNRSTPYLLRPMQDITFWWSAKMVVGCVGGSYAFETWLMSIVLCLCHLLPLTWLVLAQNLP